MVDQGSNTNPANKASVGSDGEGTLGSGAADACGASAGARVEENNGNDEEEEDDDDDEEEEEDDDEELKECCNSLGTRV